VRAFLNQTQTELSLEARRTVQEIHRRLRDVFSAEIEELNRTVTASAGSIQDSVQRTGQDRKRRATRLGDEIGQLDRLLDEVDDLRSRLEVASP